MKVQWTCYLESDTDALLSLLLQALKDEDCFGKSVRMRKSVLTRYLIVMALENEEITRKLCSLNSVDDEKMNKFYEEINKKNIKEPLMSI